MLRRRSRIAAPISLQDMGSLCFGGRVQTKGDGDTFHGDHGYAQYFTPEHPRRLALVLWHGLGQSGKHGSVRRMVERASGRSFSGADGRS